MGATMVERATWEAVAELVDRWTEGVAVVDGAVAVASRVDGALVIEAATAREPAVGLIVHWRRLAWFVVVAVLLTGTGLAVFLLFDAVSYG